MKAPSDSNFRALSNGMLGEFYRLCLDLEKRLSSRVTSATDGDQSGSEERISVSCVGCRGTRKPRGEDAPNEDNIERVEWLHGRREDWYSAIATTLVSSELVVRALGESLRTRSEEPKELKGAKSGQTSGGSRRDDIITGRDLYHGSGVEAFPVRNKASNHSRC
ncbi:hypothetical protein Tco_0524983 [Tanacetum coccineum]